MSASARSAAGREAGAIRQPLAARLRPTALATFEGQAHLVGEQGILRRQVEAGHLASMILWGPPGSGKTTLARLLAGAVGARFATLSAVMSGVADIRAVVGSAREAAERGEPPVILFIDEIHRFNKAQQDALLPHVEEGVVTLIGATTENPYFEVNAALLSRARVLRLEALDDAEVSRIVGRALEDPVGLGGRVRLAPDALEHLVSVAGGDARAALNVLEAAAAARGDRSAVDDAGREPIELDLAAIEAAAQQRTLAYDRAGDGHFDTVSAFIKSLRGNDPDAALHWLAAMIAAGEDPRFICRRLIIAASEDVGNADPRALQIAVAAAQALDWVGLPEAQYALAQATVWIAAAPKSDAIGRAYGAAMSDVLGRGSLAVPGHLRSAADRRLKKHGIGVGYRNPHEFEGDDVEQQYLPDELVGRRYYVPGDQGFEPTIAARLAEREAARRSGRRPKRRAPVPGAGMGDGMKAHTEARRRLADAERRDAG